MTESLPAGPETGPAATARDARPGLPGRLAFGLEHLFGWFLDWGAARPWRGACLVTLLALAVALPGLTAMPVTDRDEARFVQATKQMLETGDLIDIRFQDEPRWKKPVGIYWLQAAAASAFGGTAAPIWAYRIPSALALVLGALATLWAARPLVGPRAALLAGLALPVTLLAAAEGHIAKTDATLMLTSILAFGALARVLTDAAGPRTWLVFWLAVAAGVLVKGPIVPVLAVLAVATVWAMTLRLPRLGGLRPVPGLVLLIVLVAPWVVAIWIISDGAFFAESVGEDLIAKVREGQEAHGAPPGLYAVLVWLTLWPWAAFLPAAAAVLWRARREVWAIVILGWVVPFWFVLEAVPTKLPHYVLPLYPALLVAIAAVVTTDRDEPPGRWSGRAAAVLTAAPPILLALAAVLLPVVVEARFIWPAAGFGALAVLAAIVAAAAARRGLRLGQAAAGILAALALYPAILHHALPAMETAFPSPRMAALADRFRPCASGPLMSVGYREPSLVFLNGTDTGLGTVQEIADAMSADPGAMALVEDRRRPLFDEALGPDAPALVERASLTYFNYNRGKTETARLLTRDDPRWQACSAPE